MTKELQYYVKLIRPINLLMVLLTQIIFVAISANYSWANVRVTDLLLIIAAVICTTAGGYVINDLFDIEIDKINKPIKQYIPEFISYKNAHIYYWILVGISIVCGFLVGLFFGLVVLSINLLLYYYSRDLKKSAFFGNALVAFLSALVVFLAPSYGCTIVRKALIAEYSLLAFLITMAREIIKDVEDVDGDREHNSHTIPIQYGIKTSKLVGCLCISLAIVTLLHMGNIINEPIYWTAIAIVVMSMFYSIYKLIKASSTKDFALLAGFQKWILFAGILSVLLIGINA